MHDGNKNLSLYNSLYYFCINPVLIKKNIRALVLADYTVYIYIIRNVQSGIILFAWLDMFTLYHQCAICNATMHARFIIRYDDEVSETPSICIVLGWNMRIIYTNARSVLQVHAKYINIDEALTAFCKQEVSGEAQGCCWSVATVAAAVIAVQGGPAPAHFPLLSSLSVPPPWPSPRGCCNVPLVSGPV